MVKSQYFRIKIKVLPPLPPKKVKMLFYFIREVIFCLCLNPLFIIFDLPVVFNLIKNVAFRSILQFDYISSRHCTVNYKELGFVAILYYGWWRILVLFFKKQKPIVFAKKGEDIRWSCFYLFRMCRSGLQIYQNYFFAAKISSTSTFTNKVK